MTTAKTITRQLMNLGLSYDESLIYILLCSAGSMSAKEVSEQSGIVVNSIYRSVRSLELMGLVHSLETKPKKFQSVTPSIALSKLAEEKAVTLNSTSQSVIKQLSKGKHKQVTSMGILTGQKELFEDFVHRAKEAKSEILVISIGESVPAAIWSAMEQAVGRGVRARFIFHINNKENILLIKRWQSMGVEVRHVPSEGYHLFVFDDSAAVMSASNTKNTQERTGVIILNQPLIAAMKIYFEQQWSLSQTAGVHGNT